MEKVKKDMEKVKQLLEKSKALTEKGEFSLAKILLDESTDLIKKIEQRTKELVDEQGMY